MQRKPALVGAHVQRSAVRVRRSGGIVQALVEKGSRLLPGRHVVVQRKPIQMKDRAALRRRARCYEERLRGRGPQLLELPHARVGALPHRHRLTVASRRRKHLREHRPDIVARRCLREQLHQKQRAILIRDDPRDTVRLAEEQSAAVAVRRCWRKQRAQRQRRADALAQQRKVSGSRETGLAGDQARRDR